MKGGNNNGRKLKDQLFEYRKNKNAMVLTFVYILKQA